MILVVPRKLTDDFASKVRAIRHLFATLCKIVIYRVPLSSTQTPLVQHIGSTHGAHHSSTENPSVQHEKFLSSTPKTHEFNTKTPSVPHQKPLSSAPKTPQFPTKNHPLDKNYVELKGFWCGTEDCVELRDFRPHITYNILYNMISSFDSRLIK